MKEAIIYAGPKVEIIDSPIPKPNADQVVIKVVYSGSNPKDWKVPEWTGNNINQGDDIAGYIHTVGDNVTEFKPGDRVAAFHEMMSPHGSYAEYALAWSHTTFHIPKKTSFEEGSTVPLAAMTAALGLYQSLGLPAPYTPTTKPLPLIVYGGSSAVGAYAIKLAQLSNIHPVIAIAGKASKFVEGLIDRSKGDTIVDYRKGEEAVLQGIKEAVEKAGQSKVLYAYDAVSEGNTIATLGKALAPGGKINTVLPNADDSGLPDSVTAKRTMVGTVHMDISADSDEGKAGVKLGDRDFAFAFFRLFGRGLQEGWFSGHPYEVVPGGLEGVQKALKDLKDGKASGVKYIFKIADTPGVSS